MATYPVKHKETGETKDVIMAVHDWDQWKEDNPDWERHTTHQKTPQGWEKLVSGETKLWLKILVGTTFWQKHRKHLVLE